MVFREEPVTRGEFERSIESFDHQVYHNLTHVRQGGQHDAPRSRLALDAILHGDHMCKTGQIQFVEAVLDP